LDTPITWKKVKFVKSGKKRPAEGAILKAIDCTWGDSFQGEGCCQNKREKKKKRKRTKKKKGPKKSNKATLFAKGGKKQTTQEKKSSTEKTLLRVHCGVMRGKAV